MYISRYNIDEYINRCCKMGFLEICDYSQKEYSNIKKMNLDNKEIREYKYLIKKYQDFIHEFLFFLTSGMKPSGMKEEDFQRIMPIIKHLVDVVQMNVNVLKIFE